MGIFSKFGRTRLYYNFSKRFSSKLKEAEEPADEVQLHAYNLIKKILPKQNTELLLLPYEKIMYMHWKHITIKIGEIDDRIVVMNGKYYYYFSLPTSMMDELRKRFIKRLDMRKESWESKFNTCAIKNLQHVLNEVEGNK
jgi:hypothetical protein